MLTNSAIFGSLCRTCAQPLDFVSDDCSARGLPVSLLWTRRDV